MDYKLKCIKGIALIVMLFSSVNLTLAQQGFGTNTPDASAVVDMTATNKGVLFPRVSLTGTTDVTTIASPATFLTVFNTATAGTAPNNVIPGFYYWNGTNWSVVSGSIALGVPSSTSYANGGTVSGGALSLAYADGTNPGIVSTAAQIFAGAKTFSGNIIQSGATTFSTGTGGVSINGDATMTATKTLYLAGSTSGTIGLKGNGAVTNYSLTFPATVGTAGQVLAATDGTGTLGWATPATSLAAPIAATDNKGATLSAGVLKLELANGTYPGIVSTDVQVFAGVKTFTSNVGVGVVESPSAWLHLAAGTGDAHTASLKFDAGPLLMSTEGGAVEYDGSHLYFTAADAGPRYQLDQQLSAFKLVGSSSIFSTLTNTGQGVTSPNNAFFVGVGAGKGATMSSESNFIGLDAGYNATSSSSSNFVGSNAGFGATGSSASNFIGFNAGYNATSSIGSNFIGSSAGRGATNLSCSNFIGSSAGFGATNASNSNFIGQNAGTSSTTSYSTLVGYNVGDEGLSGGAHIGANNIIIGTNISLPIATANGINLGGVLFGLGTYSTTTGSPSSDAVPGGKIGIGVVTPTATLHLAAGSATASTAPLKFTNTGAALLSTTEAGAVEYDGAHLYFTSVNAGPRYQLDQQGSSLTMGTPSGSNANGGAFLAGVLSLAFADGTNPGIVSTAAQTFAGAKTFTSALTAPTSTNTLNGLIVNTGALSGITGYTQTSGNFAQSGTGTFSTGTGAVSINGDATMAATKTLYLAGSTSGTIGLNGNGAVTSYSLTLPAAVGTTGQVLVATNGTGTLGWATPATNLAAPIAATDNNGATLSAGVLNLELADATHPGIVSIAAQTFAGAKTFSSALTAPTGGNTLNGLVVNTGALSGVTGYIQTSGNFAQSGTGTLSTGTGAVSINGNATMAATKTLYLAGSISGTIGLNGNGAVTNYSLTFPATVGTAGQVLAATNGTGTLGWATPATSLGAPIAATDNNGATLSAGVLKLEVADGTYMGIVSTGAQTFAGAKTFTGNILQSGAVTLSTGTGAVSINGDATMAATKTLYLAGSTSGTIGLKGNGAVTNYSLTLPATVGTTGQVLAATNGTGTLGWATPATTLAAPIAATDLYGATLSAGGALTLELADGTHPGIVSIAAQTIAGAKSFSADVAANSGNITTTATTASLFNTTATTLNVGGAATSINLGASSTKTTVAGDIVAKRYMATMPLAITSAATTTLDLSTGNVFTINVGASIGTLTMSNAPVSPQSFVIKLAYASGTAYTITWPATFKWSGGAAPILTCVSGKVDIISVIFDGTNYYCSYGLNF